MHSNKPLGLIFIMLYLVLSGLEKFLFSILFIIDKNAAQYFFGQTIPGFWTIGSLIFAIFYMVSCWGIFKEKNWGINFCMGILGIETIFFIINTITGISAQFAKSLATSILFGNLTTIIVNIALILYLYNYKRTF